MSDSQIVRCSNCGAANRVLPEKLFSGEFPVCGKCHATLAAKSVPMKITDASFAREVEQSPLPVFLDFWAGWCGPCLMIGPFIEELANDLAGQVRVAKLNIDENPATAQRFKVHSIPTMIVFKDGREVDRIAGAVPKEMMLRRLQMNGLI
ncbi:MAG: thioredoxin [Acidobacteria bacterium]|nr:thioredoxin [Acidobacteriota bacterium]